MDIFQCSKNMIGKWIDCLGGDINIKMILLIGADIGVIKQALTVFKNGIYYRKKIHTGSREHNAGTFADD